MYGNMGQAVRRGQPHRYISRPESKSTPGLEPDQAVEMYVKSGGRLLPHAKARTRECAYLVRSGGEHDALVLEVRAPTRALALQLVRLLEATVECGQRPRGPTTTK